MVRYNIYDPIVDYDSDELQDEDEAGAGTTGRSREPPPVSREEIEKLSYREGLRLVRDRLRMSTQNLRTLEDIRNILTLRFYPTETEECVFEDIENQLKECRDKQKDIVAVCQMVEERLMKPQHVEAMREILEEMEPEFESSWKEKVKNLKSRMQANESAILIAGETGSGKSSLINLLVGKNLVPEAEHPCTSALCTIRGSDTEYVNLYEDKLTVERVDLTEENRPKINNFITRRYSIEDSMDVSNSLNRKAEFFCDMQLLKSGAFFVDTPGFRELPRLTEIHYKHLPMASAFIVVLRTDNHTGFNQSVEQFIGRVREILEELTMKNINNSESTVSSSNFTEQSILESVIFVFNRWDQIVDFKTPTEVNRVRGMCLNELRRVWPGIEEGKNVFFMSVTKTNSMIKCADRVPNEFKDFQKVLYSMVPKSLKCRLQTAYSWLEYLNNSFLTITRKKINNARKDDEVRKAEVLQLRDHLERTKETYETRSGEFSRLIREKRRDLQNTLLEYLKTEEAIKRMIDINNDETNYAPVPMKPMEPLTGGVDFDELRAHLENYCMNRVAREITYWNEKGAFEYDEKYKMYIFDNTKTNFAHFLEDVREIFKSTFKEIDKQAEFLNELFDCRNVIPKLDDVLDDLPRTHFLSNLEKVFFGMTAIIWIPLVIVGGAISLPVIAGILTNENITSKGKLEKFKKNREQITEKCIKSFMKEHFGRKELNLIIHTSVLKNIQTFETRVKGYLPMVTAKFEKQITILESDGGNLESKEKKFSPVRRNAEEILSALYNFHARYLKSYQFSKQHLNGFQDLDSDMSSKDFFKLKTVEKRNFGTFGDVGITYYETKKETIAVKIVDEPITAANAFFVFSEESMWWKLNHHNHANIVHFYGLLAFGERKRRIAFVMEACDCTLERYLHRHEELVPFRQKRRKDKERALRTVLKLSTQITVGLEFMHKMKIFHRNLRIDNILVSLREGEATPKLCDFGVSRGHSQVTATIFDSSYLRTQVLEKKGWTESADVYALGLILWEMYHDRRVDKRLHEMHEAGETTGQGGVKLECRLPFPDPKTPPLFMETIETITVAKESQITTATALKAFLLSLCSAKSIFIKRTRPEHPK